jgi:hypothetical protein
MKGFANVRSLAELSIKLVEHDKIGRHEVVYKLLKLVLVLPVATVSVERVFFCYELCEEQIEK